MYFGLEIPDICAQKQTNFFPEVDINSGLVSWVELVQMASFQPESL